MGWEKMDLGIPGIGDAVEVGVGASAQVFKARQEKLDREVAVKVLSTTDDDFVRRFHREARTLGRLSRHDGIVTLYEFGETPSGQPYLILELCEGSLLDRIQADGSIDPLDASRILHEVASTVAEAHESDVVHRDIKPANILINHVGKHLITDFGISTVLGSTSGQTSSVGFTAGYAAPETFEGSQTSGKEADVYALGATFFHMLSGQPPFTKSTGDQNLLALIQRIATEPVLDLRPQGVPDEICTILEQLLAKDRAQRPTAKVLAAQLGGFLPTAEGPAVVTDAAPPADATRSVDVGTAPAVLSPLAASADTTMDPVPAAEPQGQPALAATGAVEQPAPGTAAAAPLVEGVDPRSIVRPDGQARTGPRVPGGSFAARRSTLLTVAVPAVVLVALVFGAFQLFRDNSSPTGSAASDVPQGENASVAADDGGDSDDTAGDDTAGDDENGDPASPTADAAVGADAADNAADANNPDGETGRGAASGVSGGQGDSESTTDSTPTTTRRTTSTTSGSTSTSSTSTSTPTTAKPPAGLAITSINGPSTVTCWSSNQTYTAVTNGVAVTSWNWSTGKLGLQTPFSSGPSAVLSFDLDPGTYTITVTGNNTASRSKTITVIEGPGCAPQAPNPVIAGPSVVECNSSNTYSAGVSNGVPLTSFSWSASGPVVSSPSLGITRVDFPLAPGTYSISVTVNGSYQTTRTITVTEAAGGCG